VSEFHDFVQLPAEGQVAPTFISQPGALTTGGLAVVPAQITTQVNPGFPSEGINSIVQSEQQLAVVGPIYQSPGGILNKAPSTTTTGGGP
jgi:hypothetical protein